MRSDWPHRELASLVLFENRRRIPLSKRERDQRQGPFPYWGANGVVDHVDGYIYEGTRILVGEDGTVRRDDGRAVVHWVTGRFWVNNHAHVLWAKDDSVDPRWLFYALSDVNVDPHITGAVQPKLSMGRLKQIQVLTPPIADQKRIAAVLGALDDKIDSNRRLASLLKEAAAALFRARFIEFVGITDLVESEIGPIPRGCAVSRLGAITGLAYGKGLPAARRRAGPVAVVGSSGVVGEHDEALCPGPVIVVGRKGTAGSVHWVASDAYPIDTTFFAKPGPEIPLVFLYHLLREADLERLVADSAVPGLNRDAALDRKVVTPPAGVMRDFEAKALPMLEMAASIEVESGTLAEIRDALLPKLVSGQIRVGDVEDVVEAL